MDIWTRIVLPFFDSTFFLALTTLAIGLVAYGVYRTQKRDEKATQQYSST